MGKITLVFGFSLFVFLGLTNSFIFAGKYKKVKVTKTQKRLKATKAQTHALFDAVEGRDIEKIKVLIKKFKAKRIDLNEVKTGRSNRTVLHLASWEGFLDVVELLIEAGMDVNVLDNMKRTPLMRASYEGQKKVVEFLLDKGALVDLQNIGGEYPLFSAALENWYEGCKILLNYGANPYLKDNKNNTAFDVATREEVRYLLASRMKKAGYLSKPFFCRLSYNIDKINKFFHFDNK